MYDDTLARRIRAFRKLKGLTQRQLAEQVKVSIALIGAVERGTKMPDEELLSRICRILGISEEELRSSHSND